MLILYTKWKGKKGSLPCLFMKTPCVHLKKHGCFKPSNFAKISGMHKLNTQQDYAQIDSTTLNHITKYIHNFSQCMTVTAATVLTVCRCDSQPHRPTISIHVLPQMHLESRSIIWPHFSCNQVAKKVEKELLQLCT